MKTIIDLFEFAVEKYGNNPFIWDKPMPGKYQSTSYAKAHKKVKLLAANMVKIGIEKGDRIALLSEGREEWIISELAILYAGAVSVPLSVKLEEDELQFRLEHAECKILFVSGRLLPKIKNLLPGLPLLKYIILLDKGEDLVNNILLYSDLTTSEMAVNMLENIEISEEDMVNISYTSGTTADPKGIILTHKNYLANIYQSLALFDVPAHYRTLLILPWDHSFAHTVGIYTLIAGGASIAAVERGNTPQETLRNIPLNIKEIEPTFLLSVPALAKNFKKNIDTAIRKKGGIAAKIYHKGLSVAYKYNREGHNKGKGLPFLCKLQYKFYDWLIFSKIRKNFGRNLKFFVGGGALLNIELQRYFYAIGIPMLQGYGLSEAAPVISSNTLKNHKLGSSGKIVPDLEVKICNEEGRELPAGKKGEIVVKGNNVMSGYWKNEEATKETLKNGWLHTGDLGYFAKDGYIHVLGRYKSLLIGNDGEKYSPEGIETTVVSKSKFIEQFMLYNNQDAYTVGLVYPNRQAILRELKECGYELNTKEAAEKAIQIISREINNFRDNGKYANLFPRRWLPATLAIIPDGFNEQNRMLNSTMKMVRRRITDHYNDRIRNLYTPEGKNLTNKDNLDAMSKLLN